MTTDPTYAEQVSTIELLKARVEQLTKVAEYQHDRKLQLHAEHQKRIAALQEEISELRAELVITRQAL